MSARRKLLVVCVAVVALLGLIAVGTALGQGGFLEEPVFDLQPDPGEGTDRGVMTLAEAGSSMNYQGYLSDSGGNPLNSTSTISFSLYNDETVGGLVWGPETHKQVQVSDGLFQVALGAPVKGTAVALTPDIFSEAVWLRVWVNGIRLDPRQPLRPAAYAFGMMPGASSYLWVPGMDAKVRHDKGVYIDPSSSRPGSGWIYVTQSAYTGSQTIFLPVTLPSVLDGQDLLLEELEVHACTYNTKTKITGTSLARLPGLASPTYLIQDNTERAYICDPLENEGKYTLVATGNNHLYSGSGPLVVVLNLDIGGTVYDGQPDEPNQIYLGGVRVKLSRTN